MKIIGKWKDYFDYLQGVYGIDPLKVLDRTILPVDTYAPGASSYSLYFCGIIYSRYFRTKTDTGDFDKALKSAKGSRDYWWISKEKDELIYEDEDQFWIKRGPASFHFDFPYGSFKTEFHYPDNEHKLLRIPVLKDIGFNKVLTAEEAYRLIENHISKKDIVTENNPTNMDRFESKGFSKKTSFRH